VLYLHHKGITKLENLEVRRTRPPPPPARSGLHEVTLPVRLQAFSGVRALYLECNGISAIQGLAHMAQLRSLYLGKNLVHSLAGVAALTALQQLDLADNDLRSLEGLAALQELRSLNASGNKLAAAADLTDLAGCPRLETLDLGGNRIDDPAALDLLLALPVSLLRLVGNPVVSSTRCASLAPRACTQLQPCARARAHPGTSPGTTASAF